MMFLQQGNEYTNCTTESDGNVRCTAYGLDTISTSFQVTGKYKRTDSNEPSLAETYVKLARTSSAAATSLSSGGQLVTGIPQASNQYISSANQNIVIPVENVWHTSCYVLTTNETVAYEKEAGSWVAKDHQGALSKSSCISFLNYSQETASFQGYSNGYLLDSNASANPPLDMASSKKTGVVTTSHLDEASHEIVNDLTGSVDYMGYFEHKIELTSNRNSLISFLSNLNWPAGIRVGVNYTVQQREEGGTGGSEDWTDLRSGTINFLESQNLKTGKQLADNSNLAITVTANAAHKGRKVCQRLYYVSSIGYETQGGGVVGQNELGRTYTNEVCLQITQNYVDESTEDLDGGAVKVASNTVEESQAFTQGGFWSGTMYKMTEERMTNNFQHKAWLDISELNTDPENSGKFVGASIKDESFRSGYIGTAELFGTPPQQKNLAPKNASGALLDGTRSYALTFRIADLSTGAFSVRDEQPAGTNKSAGTEAWASIENGQGSTSLEIGKDSSSDLYLLAGETKNLNVLTKNKPSRWNIKYIAFYANGKSANVDGSEASSTQATEPYKIELGNVASNDDSEYTSDHWKNISVHRDYNFKVSDFKVGEDGTGGGLTTFGGSAHGVLAGSEEAISYSFKLNRYSDGAWSDGYRRNFLTDVFSNNTVAYRVEFEVAPGNNSQNQINQFINGFAKYDPNDTNLPEDISGLEGWLDNKATLVGSSFHYISLEGGDGLFQAAKRAGTGAVQALKNQQVYSDQSISFNYNGTLRVSDNATVGAKYCVGIFIENPVNDESGVDSDTHTSLLSELSCANVIKKPTLEVWGGDVATAGGIKTSLSEHNSINYGSWNDFGLIANDEIRGMASGRALQGGTTSLDGTAPLTIANKDTGGARGKAGIPSGLDNSVYSELLNRFKHNTSDQLAVVDKSGESVVIDNAFLADNSTCKFSDVSNPAGGKRTCVVIAKDATIKENIDLGRSSYIYGQTPSGSDNDVAPRQLLVLAQNNIRILANVTEFEAWLMTDDKVDTCSDYANTNFPNAYNTTDTARRLSSTKCINQLKIVGPIAGKTVAFERTYGGNPNGRTYDASGNLITNDALLGSSAEIVDFSPTTILFGVAEASGDAPRTTMLKKLAPRY